MSGAMAIILAAGKSTRMKSALPKVLHPVCGRPMVEYVLDATRQAGVTRIVAVVGHQAEAVQKALSFHDDVCFALQSEQLGTGHAVMVCRTYLQNHRGPVLVLAGDTPLLRRESLVSLLDLQRERQAACVIGTVVTEANQGLGRIVRDHQHHFVRIVEEKDATPEEKTITEVNTGCYAFDAQQLLAALDKIRPENVQKEYYLTDCPRVLLEAGETVAALNCFEPIEALGVNTRVQLAEVTRMIQQSTLHRLMLNGVTIVNPGQTQIDPQAEIEADTVIHPFTSITGHVKIGASCDIGPHVVLEGPLEIPAGTKLAPFTHRRG
jgi:bifunctional UDP-N-acetylglucosamine pyrophosphorylase/glucosamine-1-phosphate N-acetyltransferase